MRNKLAVIVGLIIITGAICFYFTLGKGGDAGYTADFEKLVTESGITASDISCKQVKSIRKIVCHFQSNQTDISILSNFLDLKKQENAGEWVGDRLFMANEEDPCEYRDRIARGDTWLYSRWEPSKPGVSATTYSAGALIFDTAGMDACVILDIAYG